MPVTVVVSADRGGDGPRPFQGRQFCSAPQVSLEACCTDTKGT